MENAAVITNCSRWPLIIDPQLQGIAWIRRREAPNGLVSCQQSATHYLDTLAKAMEEGLPMLLEKVGEAFDAVMDPVLSRATIRKGRKVRPSRPPPRPLPTFSRPSPDLLPTFAHRLPPSPTVSRLLPPSPPPRW